MALIEEIERRLQDVNDDAEKLKLVEKMIQSNARSWYDITGKRARNWEELKRLYKDTFWNQYVQEAVREQLESGKYSDGMTESRLQYAYTLMAKAEYLEPRIPEAMLVARLIKHFGNTFKECANLRCIETINELVKLIQRFEAKKMWAKSNNFDQLAGPSGNKGKVPDQAQKTGWLPRKEWKAKDDWKAKNDAAGNQRQNPQQKKAQIRTIETEEVEEGSEEYETAQMTSETTDSESGNEPGLY